MYIPWSGNIRELKHVVRVAVLKSRGEIITPKELDFDTPKTGAHIQFKLKIDDEKKQNHISHSPCQRQSHPSSQSPRHIPQNPFGEKEKVRTNVTYHFKGVYSADSTFLPIFGTYFYAKTNH